jgi:hypothetical protein
MPSLCSLKFNLLASIGVSSTPRSEGKTGDGKEYLWEGGDEGRSREDRPDS